MLLHPPSSASRPRPKFTPRLEALEDRAVPTVSIVQNGNTINITGDSTSERIRIQDNGTNALGAIQVFDDTTNLPLFTSALVPNGSIINVIIKMNDGNDSVRYLLTNDLDSTAGLNPTGGRQIFGEMGLGNDRFAFSATRPADSSGLRLDTGVLRVEAYGFKGTDDLTMTYRGRTTAGVLTFLANGMLGDDRILASETLLAGSTGSTQELIDGGGGAKGNDIMIGLLARDPAVVKLSATINGEDTGSDRAFFTEGEVTVFGVPAANQTPVLGG
jgi:hypothetical protein